MSLMASLMRTGVTLLSLVKKFLRKIGVPEVPNTVPTERTYARLETAMLAEADRLGITMASLDLQVWSWYAAGGKEQPIIDDSI